MADPDFNLAGYRQFLAKRKIMACRCLDSGQIYLPPRPICPASGSRNMEWVELSGEGVVVAFTSIVVAPATMAQQGYGRDKPYLSGFVALKEGPTVPARIESPQHPVRVGMPVKADFLEESSSEHKKLTLVFRPA
jgi:uncharacterized OB-fold protein